MLLSNAPAYDNYDVPLEGAVVHIDLTSVLHLRTPAMTNTLLLSSVKENKPALKL